MTLAQVCNRGIKTLTLVPTSDDTPKFTRPIESFRICMDRGSDYLPVTNHNFWVNLECGSTESILHRGKRSKLKSPFVRVFRVKIKTSTEMY